MHKKQTKSLSKYHYLFVGTLALLFLGMIYAWSIFKSPLKELLPEITDKQLSLTFTISIIFFCIGGLISGFLASKIITRYRVILASALVFSGLILMSTLSQNTTSPASKMYIYYGIICGLGVGFGYNTIISGVVEHFQDKVGMASGVLMLGFGFGGIILGSIASSLESIYGISKAFFILSFMFLPPLILCAYILGKKRESEETTSKVNDNSAEIQKSYSPKEMIKTKYFFWFIIWNVLICSCGLMIIGSASQIAQSFGAPAIVGLLVSVANGFGRILSGQIFDSKGETIAVLTPNIFLIISGTLLLAGFLSENMILGILGLLACGISYGCSPPLASSIVKNTFGLKHYPSNFSIVNFQLVIAATVGPTLSNYLKESSGGSFKLSFISILVFAAAAFLVTLLMKKTKKNIM